MDKDVDKKFAVIRIRGINKVREVVEDTLKKLNLQKKNHCVVVSKNRSYTGMIQKVKDYVTWGEIDGETYKALLDKRKEEYKGKKMEGWKYENPLVGS